MDRVIIASTDGHASMPPELWSTYLEKQYHDLLPKLQAENDLYVPMLWLFNDLTMKPEAFDVFDKEGIYQAGRWSGLWDLDVRIDEMDREGIAAEYVYHTDFRASDLFHSAMNGKYPPDALDAGARAYNRWVLDAFGAANDRLLLVGAMGACLDLDAIVSEARWLADHGFIGSYAPGYVPVSGLPPLYDDYWNPLWSVYEERELILVVHGGYGLEHGRAFHEMQAAHERVKAAGGSDADLITDLLSGFFDDRNFFADLSNRRAMWRMMLGGVFDRFPKLKVQMTEVRADWIPATLRYLDGIFDEHRADIRAKRRPSEYWERNCHAAPSFTHRCEIEMRAEIGIEQISFGRDYPHAEGTWPNTKEYLTALFAGVPENDVRKILGENAIRFLGLDRDRLAQIANRVGPTIDDIISGGDVDAELIAHFQDRSGYLKPPEGGSRLDEIEPLVDADLIGMTSRAR